MNIGNITSDNFNLDGNGKDIQIEVYEQLIEQLQQENKQLKEQLLATQTNEETFRLEMEDITKILGLDEDTIFDDVKAFVRSLEIENQKYKEVIGKAIDFIVKETKSMPTNGCKIRLIELLDVLKEVSE